MAFRITKLWWLRPGGLKRQTQGVEFCLDKVAAASCAGEMIAGQGHDWSRSLLFQRFESVERTL